MRAYVVRKGLEIVGIYPTWIRASNAIDIILACIELDTGYRPTSDYTISQEEVS